MGGPRDEHPEWRKAEKDKYHMMNLFAKQKDRLRDVENKLWSSKQKRARVKLGVWD